MGIRTKKWNSFVKKIVVMKRIGLLFLCLVVYNQLVAQYTTPGTGVDWTLDDIAAASPTTLTLSGDTYTLHEDLIIASPDIVRIDTNLTWLIEADLRITVFGSFLVTGEAVTIRAADSELPFDGFRFEEFSEILIQNTLLEYGGGLQVLTENFTLDNSTVRYQHSGTATGGAIALSRGMPVLTNNTISFNDNPAISSAANASVSPLISGNHIEANNQTNNNRPQINLGPTRASDTLRIINNTLIGDRDLMMAGGIALANLVGGTILAQIEGNTIRDNRYGITIVGPTQHVIISHNIIEDNDTQGDPMLGGSGINLNAPTGGQEVWVYENQIRRNLWGVTIQGPVQANLGDDFDNPGGNVFADNGNNGEVVALYNNGPETIPAQHNCWIEGEEITLEQAEEVIVHKTDDPSLGEVLYDPVCELVSVEEFVLNSVRLYPNPVYNQLYYESAVPLDRLQIFDIHGRRVMDIQPSATSGLINLEVTSGLYLIQLEYAGSQSIQKISVR
jgi:hypothetical protein